MLYLINQTLEEDKIWVLEHALELSGGLFIMLFVLIVLFMMGSEGKTIKQLFCSHKKFYYQKHGPARCKRCNIRIDKL